MTQVSYKVLCPQLGKVVLIKAFSIPEHRKLFDKLVKRFESASEHFNIDAYKIELVNTFVIGLDIQKELSETDSDIEEEDVYDFLYDAIVKFYRDFSVESLILHSNIITLKKSSPDVKVEQDEDGSLTVDPDDNSEELKDDNDEEDDSEELDHVIKFGEKKALLKVEKSLNKKIIGQPEPISELIKTLKLQVTGLASHTSFLFVGPTGVGKTLVAKVLGDLYDGNFFRIDCGSFTEKHDVATLKGAPPGYVGSNEESLLASKAKKSNSWVILIDEVEKASDKLYDLLLPLLDEGTITDAKGESLDFSKSIFILTSNQGLADIKRGSSIGFNKQSSTYDQQKDKVKESIEGFFKPEFLNRIDKIIYFNTLTLDDVRKIIKLELSNYPVVKSQDLIDIILEKAYSAEYGARNIKRYIRSEIAPLLADAILDKKLPLKGKYYEVSMLDNTLQVINTRVKDGPNLEVKK